MNQRQDTSSKFSTTDFPSQIKKIFHLSSPKDQITHSTVNPGNNRSNDLSVSKVPSDQHFILPSYQMHEAVVSKSAIIEATNPVPSYEEIASPTLTYSNETVDRILQSPTIGATIEALDSDVTSQDSCFKHNPSTMRLDDGSSKDPNGQRVKLRSSDPKILEVHHDLKQLEASNNIQLSVHFTKEKCMIGTKPIPIDTLTKEFSPGDHIYGYWIVENNSQREIPFDTFYTMLEGNLIYGNDLNEKKKTFLQALDFEACSCVSESQTKNQIDPIDNTNGDLKDNRLLPGVRYKRFFQFRLPEYIVDNRNGDSTTPQHLPPSMGPTNMDLTFLNFQIAYNVGIKFITIDSIANRYTCLKGNSKTIRVIPRKSEVSEIELNAREQLAIDAKDRFLSRLDECIQRIKDIRSSPVPETHNRTTIGVSSSNEKSQAYVGYSQRSDGLEDLSSKFVHELELRTEKKQFGQVKMQGRLSIVIPTEIKKVKYIAPANFRNDISPSKEAIDSWNISVPIQMTYQPMNERNRLPEMIHVKASLVAFSFATQERSFPFELCPSMIFNNDNGKTFNDIVIGPIRQKMTALIEESKKLGSNHLISVEKSLFEDARCINGVRTKLNILDVVDVGVGKTTKLKSSLISWTKQEDSPEETFTKEICIRVNLTKAVERSTNTMNVEVPTYDRFCLVPDFQIGCTGRFYFLKLYMAFMDGSEVTSRIPVTVMKD